MVNTDYRHYVLICDRSGSMGTIREETENGIKVFVDEQRKVPGKATLSLFQFDNLHDQVFDFLPLIEVPHYTLQPRGQTALLDAIGFAVTKTGERLAAMPEEERPGKVLVLIATDGKENFSKEYNKAQVKDMIGLQQETYGWTFSYAGANVNSFAEAGGIGIDAGATLDYLANTRATKGAWAATAAAGRRWSADPCGQSVMSYTAEERSQASQH